MTRSTFTVEMVAATAAAAVLATAFPLWTWSLSLAAFGLPHVLVELRWVDERFGARAGRRTVLALGALLLAIATTRAIGAAGLADPTTLTALELVLAIAVAACALPLLLRFGPAPAVIGAGAVLALALGVARAPLDTLIAIAFLHNLTPVGFLAERLSGRERRRAMLACVVAFGALPLLIATAAPASWLASAGIGDHDTAWLATGSLHQNLGVFVPGLVPVEHAADLFRCAAFLQCMHYLVVLAVLPRLGAGSIGWVQWPSPRRFHLAVAALGAIAFAGFVTAFHEARAVYGAFAAIHAWLEVPVLLLAAGAGLGALRRAEPTAAHG